MKIPIGLQLYSVRGECARDLPGTLRATAEMGYLGAEPWGYDGKSLEWQGHSATEIRQMFDDNGLRCCGMHMSTDALSFDNLQRTIEFNHTLGNRFLIVAADQDRMSSIAGVMQLADILDDAAESLAEENLLTGYHAHGFDFVTLDSGYTAWDMLFSNTLPGVIMQMDIGNCASGGGDPIATLRRFPRRARSVHLKDYGGAPDSVIGEGQADWHEIFHICETIQNTEWYVVEEGSEDGTGFEIPQRSIDALRRMGRLDFHSN